MITPRKLRRTLSLNCAIYYNTIFAQSVHKFEDVIISILRFNIFLVKAVHLKQGYQAYWHRKRNDKVLDWQKNSQLLQYETLINIEKSRQKPWTKLTKIFVNTANTWLKNCRGMICIRFKTKIIMRGLSQWKSNAKAIANLSVTTKNALVGDGANQDNQNQRRMHQICEKSSPQMWANHVLHMRAILSRLITFCSLHQIFQQMHP